MALDAADLRALAALAALGLLPGIVLVRAPWTAVPSLSLATWIVTGAWMGLLGGSRTRFLEVFLIASAALAALRLVRVREPGEAPLSWRPWAVLVGGLAASRLVPFLFWPVPPGSAASFTAATALLHAWHDGPPFSFEPLFPVACRGLDGAAVVAGDLILLARLDAPRACLLIALAAEGLTVVAGFQFARRFVPEPLAALATLGAAALGIVAPGEWPRAALAVALAVSAGAVLSGGRGRSGAVAAGLILSAAVLTDPVAALLVAAVLVVTARALAGARELDVWRGPTWRRLALATAVAGGLGFPIVLRPPVPWTDLEPSSFGPVIVLVAAVVLVRGAAARPVHRAVLAVVAGLAMTGACLAYERASARMWLTEANRRAMMAVAARTRPLDVVCAPPDGAGAWVPAVAGRATSPLAMPGQPLVDRGRCAATYVPVGERAP